MAHGLDRYCPRCGQAPDAPPKKAIAEPVPQARVLPRNRRPDGGPWVVGIALAVVVACLAVGVVSVLRNPHRRALASYQVGLQHHLRGDFDAAIARYTDASGLDAAISAPSLMAGMACAKLGTRTPNRDELEALVKRATWGDTAALQRADSWFAAAIQRCDANPQAPTGDASLGDSRRVKSMAHSLMGITALLRSLSAIDARKADQAEGWLQVAQRQCQEAQQADPSNEQARKLLELMPGK